MAARATAGTAARGLRPVPEDSLLWRVRFRLGLGRCLPAARPRLLPQAVGRGAFHAGAGFAVAGAGRVVAPVAAARPAAVRAPGSVVIGASVVPVRRRPRVLRGGRMDAARERAVPLDAARAGAVAG